MKLDDRIINPLEIYSPVNAMSAQVYIGQNGIFSNDPQDFENLKNAELRVLTDLELREGYTKRFCGDGRFWYEYFLPLANVEPKKEKVFRPCTLDDFGLNIGDLIRFRRKGDNDFETCTMYMGYIKNSGIVKVQLGTIYYSLKELFEDYEWFDKDSNTWEPFGVKE